MKHKIKILSFPVLIAFWITAIIPSVILADDNNRVRTFEVTVTNITTGAGEESGQILNGLVVIAHNKRFQLFKLGQPARDELAQVAEDANNADLIAVLSIDRNVCSVTEAGLPAILPGESVTVKIRTRGRCRFLSMAAMLVTSNDAFAALNGEFMFRGASYLAPAYDAGSEENTENCAHIPGPPCGIVNRIGGGEGYVSIHSGIHGQAGGNPTSDLNPSKRDWNNPVAYITIKQKK